LEISLSSGPANGLRFATFLYGTPQRYLTSVLAKIGQTPTCELAQFLPDIWKQEDAAEPAIPST